MRKKVLVAMSGGVDSSVAAYILKQQGYDCTGITMKLFDNEAVGAGRENACCTAADVEDARNVAHQIGIPFYVQNFSEEFYNEVIGRFVDAYENGATPNPCIDCNRYMKFEKLLCRAKELGMDYIATGHYAKIEYNAKSGRYLLKKAEDKTKEQSYALYTMTQEQLSNTLFPLGGMKKADIRTIAQKEGFVNAAKRDSQDICFVREGNYAEFIENYTGKIYECGDVIDADGNVLGKHKGLIHYTVGQRKGFGLALPTPMYVRSKDIKENTITLCTDDELYTNTLYASEFNWIAYEGIDSPIRVQVMVRYRHTGAWATAQQKEHGMVHVVFDEPQRAIAKGQAAVLYDGDVVFGGGTIVC